MYIEHIPYSSHSVQVGGVAKKVFIIFIRSTLEIFTLCHSRCLFTLPFYSRLAMSGFLLMEDLPLEISRQKATEGQKRLFSLQKKKNLNGPVDLIFWDLLVPLP